MAVAKGITRCTGMEAKIKWPNDIVINGKKVVGILTEMSAQMDYVNHIVVGIGINVNNESFPEEIAQNATSLLLQSGKRVNRAALIEAVWEEFEHYYDRFMAYQDLRDLRKEYDASLATGHYRPGRINRGYLGSKKTGVFRGSICPRDLWICIDMHRDRCL